MRRLRRGLLGVAGLLASAAACAAPHSAPNPSTFVVLLVVDQLRPDRAVASLPGGIGRLLREGRVFSDAVLAHAASLTCPGHVAIATGRHPGPVGVPGNSYVDPDDMRLVYCVEDRAADAALLGGDPGPLGRSPRNIRVSALGDWLKAAHPGTNETGGSRVFSVSAKDRSAIALGGRHPDAAFWFDRMTSGAFTTSRYYADALPPWAAAWTAERVAVGLPDHWRHPTDAPGARPDDDRFESERFSRTSPHPLAIGVEPRDRRLRERLRASPYMDQVTLSFARALVEAEGLGRSAAPDLLAISLSATDVVGHHYGPRSQEAADALIRLDRALGEFLGFLEERKGDGALVVVLTSDHGVLPLPERFAESGEGRCPVAGGRIDTRALEARIERFLEDELGAGGSPGWIVWNEDRIRVNRHLAAAHGIETARVVDLAATALEREPGVTRVWRAEELSPGGVAGPEAALFRASYDPERSGELIAQFAYGCLASGSQYPTSHGSVYDYDRRVPLVFWGSGVAAGRVSGAAAVVDIAPTLARALELPEHAVPGNLDGRPLALR